MRLAFILPPEIGGHSAEGASDLGRRLVARGHSVEIVPVIRGPLGALPHAWSDFDALVFFSCAGWVEELGPRLPEERIVSVDLEAPEIGPGVELAPETSPGEAPLGLRGLGNYLLLTGPLDAQDGYAVTVDAFLRAEREGRTPLTLVLVGRGRISLGENVHVRHLGDVSDAARDEAMRGALAVLVPSRREAVSSAALQAWNLGRPVVAHGPSGVMRRLVTRAQGGVVCETGEELAAALEVLAAEPSLADALGRQGRAYLAAHHAWPVVLDEWESLFARIAAKRGAAA